VCAVSLANLTEVLIAPAADALTLAATRQAIAALGVTVHQPNVAIAVEAHDSRGRHPISLPDAYCLATAKHTSSPKRGTGGSRSETSQYGWAVTAN
jgi:hypothetical protein